MDSQILVSNIVNKLFSLFVNVKKVEYEYHEYSDTHFIKIPQEVFNSEKFLFFDSRISLQIYQEFPTAQVCFITKGSLTELVNPEVIVKTVKTEELISRFEKKVNIIANINLGIIDNKTKTTVTTKTKTIEYNEIKGELIKFVEINSLEEQDPLVMEDSDVTNILAA